MSDYLSWSDLKARWDKLDFQLLVDYLPKMLQPYSRHGNPIPCPTKYHEYYNVHSQLCSIKDEISKRKNNPDYDVFVSQILPPCPADFPKKSNEEKLRALENEKFNLERKLTKIEKEDPKCEVWKYFINPVANGEIEKIIADLSDAVFKKEDVSEFEKKFNLGPINKKKKLRPSQKARAECRKVAKKLRDTYPEMSISEMADLEEIMKFGGNYTKDTRRKWICDLFPEHLRLPGRKRYILKK